MRASKGNGTMLMIMMYVKVDMPALLFRK